MLHIPITLHFAQGRRQNMSGTSFATKEGQSANMNHHWLNRLQACSLEAAPALRPYSQGQFRKLRVLMKSLDFVHPLKLPIFAFKAHVANKSLSEA
jgi:hypothetical protein